MNASESVSPALRRLRVSPVRITDRPQLWEREARSRSMTVVSLAQEITAGN